jgi:hypothetical protein
MITPRQNVRRAQRHNVLRRCIVMTMLLVYTTTAVGLPLPLGGKSLIQGEGAYPCAAGACGCRSADHCWTSCCCHTLAERLAWAKRRGIQPPREAVDKARRQGLDMAWLENSRGDNGEKPNCCAAEAAGAAACGGPNESACARSDETPGSDHAIVLSALRCQGKSVNWLAAVVQNVDIQLTQMDEAPLVARLIPVRISHLISFEPAPPDPPPESI